MIDENTSRQVEELYRSDDWAELRWAREHSTPQQIARHLLDPQWRNRDYNALDDIRNARRYALIFSSGTRTRTRSSLMTYLSASIRVA